MRKTVKKRLSGIPKAVFCYFFTLFSTKICFDSFFLSIFVFTKNKITNTHIFKLTPKNSLFFQFFTQLLDLVISNRKNSKLILENYIYRGPASDSMVKHRKLV